MTETSEHIEKMYGHHYTPQTISNMTKVMVEHVDVFMKRPLEKRYVCVYIAAGIREVGTKEVLTYAVAPTESAYIWKELLQDVKQRGTEQILLFISDGLIGIVNVIQEIHPQAKYQTCCVHLARNIAHKVRVSDRAEVCEDFKSVYRSDDEEAGKAALATFCDKWKTAYPRVVKSLFSFTHNS